MITRYHRLSSRTKARRCALVLLDEPGAGKHVTFARPVLTSGPFELSDVAVVALHRRHVLLRCRPPATVERQLGKRRESIAPPNGPWAASCGAPAGGATKQRNPDMGQPAFHVRAQIKKTGAFAMIQTPQWVCEPAPTACPFTHGIHRRPPLTQTPRRRVTHHHPGAGGVEERCISYERRCGFSVFSFSETRSASTSTLRTVTVTLSSTLTTSVGCRVVLWIVARCGSAVR